MTRSGRPVDSPGVRFETEGEGGGKLEGTHQKRW